MAETVRLALWDREEQEVREQLAALYRAFVPRDLFDIATRRGLHFDQARQTGVLFHMLATVAENGRFGLVTIGDSHEQAQELYERIETAIQEEAHLVLQPTPVGGSHS